MYDLCTRPEQPEPTPANREMESREEAKAFGAQQPELRGSVEQHDKQHGLSDKAAPTTANVTTTSLLGKRHHSPYANLSGLEMEGIHKVSAEHQCVFLMVNGLEIFGPG